MQVAIDTHPPREVTPAHRLFVSPAVLPFLSSCVRLTAADSRMAFAEKERGGGELRWGNKNTRASNGIDLVPLNGAKRERVIIISCPVPFH